MAVAPSQGDLLRGFVVDTSGRGRKRKRPTVHPGGASRVRRGKISAPGSWMTSATRRNNRIDRRRHGLEPTAPPGPIPPPPSFFQAFPNKCDFLPSFSKECLGGFVGFQGVTIDPNLKIESVVLQIFWRRKGARGARASWGRSVLVEHHGKTVAQIRFSRKINRRTRIAASEPAFTFEFQTPEAKRSAKRVTHHLLLRDTRSGARPRHFPPYHVECERSCRVPTLARRRR